MSNPLCPQCQHSGRLLEMSSTNAWVEYYRCDPCSHVWYYAKGDPNATAISVTSPIPTSAARRPTV